MAPRLVLKQAKAAVAYVVLRRLARRAAKALSRRACRLRKPLSSDMDVMVHNGRDLIGIGTR